jgi:hypothetical protein
LEPSFVTELSSVVDRNSSWTVVHNDGDLSITVDERTFSGSVTRAPLPQ